MKRQKGEEWSRREDGGNFQPFPFLPRPLAPYFRRPQISLFTTISKIPYFQCHWPKSNPHPSPPLLCINHPSIPNSSCLLAFSLYLPHTHKYTFFPLPHSLCLSLLVGSLKTSLSREEGKVLFCLISLLSLVWRNHS